MKEFPELRACVGPEVPAAEYTGETFIHILTAHCLVALYNELRAAYLGLLHEVRLLREQVRLAAECRYAMPTGDPRLPGERRVPMEPGLYLARKQSDTEWTAIAEVCGQSPYLQRRHYWTRLPDLEGEPHFALPDAVFYGPRLYGPDWRKLREESNAEIA